MIEMNAGKSNLTHLPLEEGLSIDHKYPGSEITCVEMLQQCATFFREEEANIFTTPVSLRSSASRRSGGKVICRCMVSTISYERKG